MKQLVKISLFLLLFIIPLNPAQSANHQETEMFRAEVLEVLEEKRITDEKGKNIVQQNLKLRGDEGKWQGREFQYLGISELQVIKSNEYEPGDKVIVSYNVDIEGNKVYYITDYARSNQIYWMAAIFVLAVLVVGRWKGLRSLLSLVLTFIIILKGIIPAIMAGYNPLLVTVVGSAVILFLIIYVTWGKSQMSNIAFGSIALSLVITVVISYLFVKFARLTGFSSEEAFFITSIPGASINIQGLLLAGIIVGALGVLDDIAIAQASTVKEIHEANPNLSSKEVYKKAMKVGTDHLGSMINTLFLAYAGAALPLLILFSLDQPPFLSFTQTLNNEMISTEVVRTISGSIGLLIAVPLTTWIAVKKFVKK